MRSEKKTGMAAAIPPLPVIPAQAGIQMPLRPLDYSLRSPSGPSCGRSTRYALLSRLRGDDGSGCVGRVSPSEHSISAPHSSRLTPHSIRGFTLIELLVALAVISLGMLAAVKAGGGYAGNLDYLQQRTYAHWVARNALNELRLGEGVGSNRRTEEARFAGRDWYWVAEFEGTPEPELVRAEVRVWAGDRDEGESLARLTGFMERP